MLTQRLLSLSLAGTEWVIYLLVFLSVFSVAMILERVMVLRRKRGDLTRLESVLLQLFKKGDIAGAENILMNEMSSGAKIALSVIRTIEAKSLDPQEALAIALSQEKLELESRFALLGTLGSNAPFLGLFGTVLGIIKAFHDLSLNAQGGPAVVMAGISEALVATALGLFVAIPAVCAYNYFSRYVKKIIVASENFTVVVVSYYKKHARKGG